LLFHTPHSALRIPHSALRTPHLELRSVAALVAVGVVLGAGAYDARAVSVVGDGYVVEYNVRDQRDAHVVAGEAGRALPELKALFGPEPHGPVTIVLASSIDEFHEAIGTDVPTWAVGIAISSRNRIVLKSNRLASRRGTSLRQTVRHELTHIVLGANYDMGRVPLWLNEGIAMWQADEPTFRGDFNLGAAALFGRLVPLHRLDIEFKNARNDVASVCYAQSRSLVNFILAEHGEPALLDLLARSRSAPPDASFIAAFGRSPADLYIEWRRSTRRYTYWYSIMSGIGLFWIMILLAVAARVRKHFWGRRKLAQWDEEDPDRLDLPF